MNETQWKHRLQYARDHYPPGTRVRLLAMPDDPSLSRQERQAR